MSILSPVSSLVPLLGRSVLARHRASAGALTGALSAGLCLAAGLGWSAPAPTSSILRYEVQLSAPGQPPQKLEQTIWLKGAKFRVEMASVTGKAGQPH